MPLLGMTHIKKIKKSRHFPLMSIDTLDVNTMNAIFSQRKSNELQENHTQYLCNIPIISLIKKSNPPPLCGQCQDLYWFKS